MMEELDPLVLPELDSQDLWQEILLLRLEGKTPKKSIVKRRLERQSRFQLFSTDLPMSAQAMYWGNQLPEPGVIEDLVEWAVEQHEDIRDGVFSFLSDPSEEGLTALLAYLADNDLLPAKSPPEKRGSRLSRLLLRTLERCKQDKGGVTMEELYEVARLNHVAKRPNAATRQLIRRYCKEGKVEIVYINGQTHYRTA